ncbi:UNVERIFIED_CONTAM: hypothetical protein NY603_19420, partial [Bacteroidetes bacterium 56_B9]
MTHSEHGVLQRRYWTALSVRNGEQSATEQFRFSDATAAEGLNDAPYDLSQVRDGSGPLGES